MNTVTVEQQGASRRALAVLAAESVLLGAILMAAAIRTGPKIAALPDPAWFGIGVALLILTIAPVHLTFSRGAQNRRLGTLRSVAAAAVGGVVAALMSLFIV